MAFEEMELFLPLAAALVVGLLIGIERGWHQREMAEGSRVAGIRTFALMGLLGGVLALLAEPVGDYVMAIGFVAIAGLVTAAHWLRRRRAADVGMTTEVAVLLTLALAMLAVRVSMEVALAAAVVVVVLLNAKGALHRWLQHMQKLELVAAIKLAAISLVLLPILPDQGFGPGDVLNPFRLWMLVVLIVGISFLGYFAIKIAGPRLGSLLTGVFGGLASSTALTISFARLGQGAPALQTTLAAGVAVGAATMLVRLLIIVLVLNIALLEPLTWPLGAMAVAGYLGALLLWWRSGERAMEPGSASPMRNPFELGMAVKFGLILTVVFVVAELAKRWMGDAGVYAVAVVSGLADVDAISISVANMASVDLALQSAVAAILLAAVTNTLVKSAIVWALCGGRMAVQISAVAAFMAAAAGAVWWLRG